MNSLKYAPLYCLIFFFFNSCNALQFQDSRQIKILDIKPKKSELTFEEWQNWLHKDIIKDTIPGISLEKAYTELLKTKKVDTIIVAVLDMRIHKNHDDIKDFIWKNTDEIPNNGIDDDNNGYIDDINGWNFLGNSNGIQSYRANFEYVRIIRKFKEKFEDKNSNTVRRSDRNDYAQFLRAKKAYKEEYEYVSGRIAFYDSIQKNKELIESELSALFPNASMTLIGLSAINTTDTLSKKKIALLKGYIKNNDNNISRRSLEQRYLDIYLNLNYKERLMIGDNVDDIKDTLYGNNIITSDTTEGTHTHAIKVAGIIGADRNNNIGIKGITNAVKLMPIAISPYGDEQDKDMALGIRYAVNNGAKIINISSSKTFSLYQDWVLDALKYAEKKDVLIVTSAGNEGEDLEKYFNYPNDTNNKNKEVVKNFIKVGASSHLLNENLMHQTSNYGKESVDIFAPGRYIYSTHPNNSYKFTSGTSFSAPIVTGIASLIRSHYPNLSATEVKQIIMESGVSYDIMVNKPSTSEEKELVPFSSLSKSGKIVNAYNALLMAEEVSKKKKRK